MKRGYEFQRRRSVMFDTEARDPRLTETSWFWVPVQAGFAWAGFWILHSKRPTQAKEAWVGHPPEDFNETIGRATRRTK